MLDIDRQSRTMKLPDTPAIAADAHRGIGHTCLGVLATRDSFRVIGTSPVEACIASLWRRRWRRLSQAVSANRRHHRTSVYGVTVFAVDNVSRRRRCFGHELTFGLGRDFSADSALLSLCPLPIRWLKAIEWNASLPAWLSPPLCHRRPAIRRTLFTIPPASRREPAPAAVSAPSTTWGAFFATT